MIFDFRVFLGQSFDGTRQSAGELLGIMDTLGIQMALAYPFKPLSYDLGEANQELANSIRPYADRLLGAARIDPWKPEAPEILLRALGVDGLRALYLNPWEEHFRADLDRLDPLMAIAQAHKVPVIVAAGYPWMSEALQIAKLAGRWPEVPVVMTNGGQINISGLGQADATLALGKCPNLSIDTAGVYRQDFIEETVEEFGAGRVLFGSGAPYFDARYEVQRVLRARVDEDSRNAIAAGNALHFFGMVWR
jgi:predicted TIM-barrel fold metal-dependent hydrolase